MTHRRSVNTSSSTGLRPPAMDPEVVVVGAGVVGCAVALSLARRGSTVALLDREPAPGLAASGTNSGILHTGFDATPGEPETDLILRAARLRDSVLDALGVPVLRCGALLRPHDDAERDRVARLIENARLNGVEVSMCEDGALKVAGEAIIDPVAFTLALAEAAQRHGAELRTGFRVVAVERHRGRLCVVDGGGARVGCRALVNCAGLEADEVAALAGDTSFEIYPRKGEFLVFEPPAEESLDRILLPVPTKETKGVLVFPTLDGKVVTGPTAVDQDDKDDWSVRTEAASEILPAAATMWPPLEDAVPLGAYAGLRPAGRNVNYLIGPSSACRGLVNVAAIRSTGLTASLAIAESVCSMVSDLGVELREERPLEPASIPEPREPWWRRTAEHRAP